MRLVKRLLVIFSCGAGLLAAAEPVQKQFTAQQRAWWAFQKITNPAPPQVQDSAWVKTPVDAFILARLSEKHLAVSGKLNAKMGGPGVFPPLPEGINPRGGWKKNEDPSEAARRSVYIFVRRNDRYPMLESFDMPDTHESCARRNVAVTPTQSLALLNSSLVLDWAHGFAERVLNDKGLSPEAQVDRAYKLAYGRTPSDDERRAGLDFLKQQEHVAGTWENALADFCHVLLNSNEFLYVN